jgi:nitrate reductase NapE component
MRLENRAMTPEQQAGGPQNRKRFVISLEQPQVARSTTKRRRRLWPRIVAALGIIVVLVAVLGAIGGFLWWRHYRTTPAYSLALLVDAVQRNDIAAVNEIVDIDKIVDGLAAEVTQKSVARYGSTLGPQQRRRVEALVPVLLPGVKQNVRDSLVKRLREISEKSEPKPFIVLAIGLPYLVKITTEGDTARAVAPVENREIELTLQRNGDRWKVEAMKDDTVVPRIVDDIVKDFPAIGSLR